MNNYANYDCSDVTCFQISHIFLSDMNKNFMLFMNIYGFMRFLCNLLALQALQVIGLVFS